MRPIKELLQILLSECIRRDFKTMCSDELFRYTGMCTITDDIRKEDIISKEEYDVLFKFLGNNEPEDINHGGHWYPFDEEGKNKRFKFLENHINF